MTLEEIQRDYRLEAAHALKNVVFDPDLTSDSPQNSSDKFYSMVESEFTRLAHGLNASGQDIVAVAVAYTRGDYMNIPELPTRS